jgi:hypothetical protein
MAMKDEQIAAMINDLLRTKLGHLGFDHAVVKSGRDHADEPALFIDAVFKPGSGPLDGPTFSGALRVLSDGLIERGDQRFPYLTSYYPDDEIAEDAEGPAMHAEP